MAFPTVAQITTNRQTSTTTSHPVSVPTGLEPGSVLLFVEFCHNNLAPESHPDGFSNLFNAPASFGTGNVNISVWGYLYLAALLPILGVERPRPVIPGGTVTLTTSSARQSDIYAIAFAEKGISLSYFLFARSNGGASAIDPPSLTYSGSAKDVLWWALGTGIGFQWGTDPASYTLHSNHQNFSGSTPSSWGTALVARQLNAATENPGAFAGTGPTSDWHAITMGVALDGP